MKTSAVLFSLSALAAASTSPAPEPWQPEQPVLGTSTLHGCYSSNIPLSISAGVMPFNSPGTCEDACAKKPTKPYAVAAMQGDECWCGDKYPAKSAMVNTTECAEPCPGFGQSPCGNLKPKRWTVLNTGVELKVEDAEEGTAQTQSSAVSSTIATDSPMQSSTQSSAAVQTSSTAASPTPAESTTVPAAGAARAVVGGAAVAAMGVGVLNFL